MILSGAVLGPFYGALSQIIYLITGLLGVPIFSMGGGPGYIFQPTFGYLLSFPIASYVIGYLIWGKHRFSQSDPPHFGRIVFANTAGSLIIFMLGVAGLYLNAKFIVVKPLTFSQATWIGFIIFIPASILKIIISSIAVLKMSRAIDLSKPS